MNPNSPHSQNVAVSVPAKPQTYDGVFGSAIDLSAVGGNVGLTRNGGAVFSCYGGSRYGTCSDWASSAVQLEGATFDLCGGHACGVNCGYKYHYHIPPTCLLRQLGQSVALEATQHSPHVGWMYDGFPLYGNRGVGGVLMRRCGAAGADATLCLDKCNGRAGTLPGLDDFTYRYYMTGTLSDEATTPTSPLPDESFFPHTPFCLVGCCPAGTSNCYSRLPPCQSAFSSAGTLAGYVATALGGIEAYYEVPTSAPTLTGATHAPSQAPIPASPPSPAPTGAEGLTAREDSGASAASEETIVVVAIVGTAGALIAVCLGVAAIVFALLLGRRLKEREFTTSVVEDDGMPGVELIASAPRRLEI